MTNYVGTAGNDVQTGTSGNDGFDYTQGGNDTLSGLGGDDTFSMGGALTAADAIDGGSGTDTLILNGDYTAGLSFAATTITNIETLKLNSGHGYKLTLADGNVTAGQTLTIDASALTNADTLQVAGSALSAGSLSFTGGAANSSIIGGAGNDMFVSGAGNETFDGGTGRNTVSYQNATGGVTVNLGSTSPIIVGGGMGNDTLLHIQNVIGSSYGDTLTTGSTNNTLDGGDGNDTLFDYLGNATLIGGAGNDTISISGGTFIGPDVVDAGSGDDVIAAEVSSTVDGGTGNDYLILNSSWSSANLTVTFAGGSSTPTSTSLGGSIVNCESLQLNTGSGNDTLTLTRFAAGAAFDTWNGGGGNDTAVVDLSSATVNISTLTNGVQWLIESTDTTTTYASLFYVENLDITSGAGSDTLAGGWGNDTFDGGSSVDTAVYAGNKSTYTITQTSTGKFTVTGPNGTDALTNIEYAKFDDQTIRLLPGSGTTVNFAADPSTYMGAIRDFDGNDLGGAASWKLIGTADVNGDGLAEHILFNKQIGRWAEVGSEADGKTYFANNGWAGDTRVVGIYIDPLVANGTVVKNSDTDSQRRFQNDLQIDNIKSILGQGDYNHDGLQEIYFSLTDGTAYLHAYMHADGNIQYANYQNKQQVIDYLTSNGFSSSTWASWFPAGQSVMAAVAG